MTNRRFAWFTAALLVTSPACAAEALAQPSYDCSRAQGDIQSLVCRTPDLAALDRKLNQVYATASKSTDSYGVARLKAEQRGWIKGRDECWKSDDKPACTRSSYTLRIAELQANYRLVKQIGPVFFGCNGDPANELVVTYFETDPRTLIAERGDRSSLMYAQPAASGARYAGRNTSFWEHHGEARVSWGSGAAEMVCKPK